MAHVVHTSVYSKMDIRTMVTDAIRRGVDIDRPVEGSNTLLHLAVQMNLCKTVGKLLSAGADPKKENDEGQTAGSIALDNGNQMILQALSLRDEYTVHLRLFNRAQDVSSSRGSMASVASELCSIVSKMIPISMPVPYEDYMDWTDSQRCRNLQSLMEQSRNEEKALRRTIDDLHEQRARNTAALGQLHHTLREREHGLCIEVWEAIQSERSSRRAFERATTQVAAVKELLQNALKYVHYFGIVRVAPFKKVFLKSWHRSFVEITGSALVIGNYHDENPVAGKSFSFSMSYKGKSNARRRPSTTNDTANTNTYATTKPSHASNTHDSDADTDGSNGAATYATGEMMAAHALGRAGLPASPTRANTASNSATHYTGGASSHSASASRSGDGDSALLAPLRRQFQKLSDKHGQCRSIQVQDIVAVEVCKVDKSLGTSYIQIELRIHYLKEGNSLSLLMSPVPVNPASSAASNTNNSSVGEGRERLPSNSSTVSGNSATNSVRTTSSTSVSNAVSSLLSPFKAVNSSNKHSTPTPTTSTTPHKSRSISTGTSSATPTFTPIPLTIPSTATTPNSSSATRSRRRHVQHIPQDKLEVVWFKLPMQSNTISSRALAKGRADDTEGPVLTFELFVAILRRIKEEIKVFAVTNGVETNYKVSPPIEENNGGSPSTNTGAQAFNTASIAPYSSSSPALARKLSRIDSFTSPKRSRDTNTASPFGSPSLQGQHASNTAANTSFYRKVLSSGDLASMDSPGLGDRPPRPHAVVGSNAAMYSASSTTNSEVFSAAPMPSPLDLSQSLYTRTDSYNTSGSGSGRTEISTSGVSVVSANASGGVSPKRNANSATFSSVLSLSASNSGTYPSGSLNSASGLTSLESLVGMTMNTHRGGGSHYTSTSQSMSSSGLSGLSASISTTTSMGSGGGYGGYKSPRYAFVGTDPLYEETSADIQSMLEEEEEELEDQERDDDEEGEGKPSFSYSHSHSYSNQVTTDDDNDSNTVHSSSGSHSPRFLKLSRRYTEGDQALNTTHDVSVHSSITTSHHQEHLFVTEDPTHHRPHHTTHSTFTTRTTHVVTHVEHGVRGCSFASTGSGTATGTSVFRDVESGDEAEAEPSETETVTTRHTIGGGDNSGGSVLHSPGKSAARSASVNIGSGVNISSLHATHPAHTSFVPSTPPSKRIPIAQQPHPHTTTGVTAPSAEHSHSQLNEQLSFSAPPVALRRDSSRSSASGANRSTESPRSPRKSADANTMSRLLLGTSSINMSVGGGSGGESNTSSNNNLIHFPAKLSRMLERARAKRSKIENRLVHLLESREKLREIIQYLQSLRAIVDCPPPTPTRSLARTSKAPSIDKAMQLLNVYGDHINHVTEGLNATFSVQHHSNAHTSESRGRLYDAEEFVRAMLSNSNTGNGSGSNSGSYNISTMHTYSTNTHSTLHSYGNDYGNFGTYNDRESFASTTSAGGRGGGATPSVSVSRRVGNSVASLGSTGTYSTQHPSLQHSNSTGAASPAHIRRLFSEASTDYATSSNTTSNMFSGGHSNPYHYASQQQGGGSSHGYNNNSNYYSNSNRNSFSFRPSLTARDRDTSNYHSGREGEDPSPSLSEPTPQLLRSPPPGYKPEFIAVMSQLERIWECELDCFHTVEKLAQCLDQRGRTWQRLKALREQEQSMVVPTQQDLYDIEF